MLPHEDEYLVKMVRRHLEGGGPIEPLADRIIELGHQMSDMDRRPMRRVVFSGMKFDQRSYRQIQIKLWQLCYDIHRAIDKLGHRDLADWIPF
jgi:hypothetical protein